MDILVKSGSGDRPKDRNRLVADWMGRNVVHVTAPVTMNKYVRQIREVEASLIKSGSDVAKHGIFKSIHIPEPSQPCGIHPSRDRTSFVR
jgi:hypothetical protein